VCLLAVYYRLIAAAPILVAANREERYDRPALPPRVQDGSPRVICGVDQQAGGTWLGVNELGLLVAVTNRPKSAVPPAPRSRGLLCRDLLDCRTAAEATERAQHELASGRYAGANYLCLDPDTGSIVHGGDQLDVVHLQPGLHLITNGDANDPLDARQSLARCLFEAFRPASIGAFLDVAYRACAHPYELVRKADRGTVGSELFALAVDPADSIYLRAPGPPDRCRYEDWSELLRAI
jgi:uncharacterized protein with NRDE domain